MLLKVKSMGPPVVQGCVTTVPAGEMVRHCPEEAESPKMARVVVVACDVVAFAAVTFCSEEDAEV